MQSKGGSTERALVSSSRLDKFPNATLVNLITPISYRISIHLQVYTKKKEFVRMRFRFENVWLDKKELEEVVQFSWQQAAQESIPHKIKACTGELEN